MQYAVSASNTFRLVFSTALGITLLCGGVSCWLASSEHLNPQQSRIFETSSATWQMGVGAIFGLLGSKATDSFESKKEKEGES
jgi:hypothetical protein